MQKKGKILWMILILFGLVFALNLLGVVVEILFTTGILQTDLARVRTLHPISFTITLAFLAANLLFLIYLYKQKKKARFWWHVFMGISIVNVLYQIVKPTFISLSVPNYYIIVPITLVIIWGSIFYLLEKVKLT